MPALLIPLGLVLAAVLSTTIGRCLSPKFGVAVAWILGALLGCPCGCIVFLFALSPGRPEGPVVFGSIGGLVIGAIVGPITALMAVSNQGGWKAQPPRERVFGYVFLPVVFILGVLGAIYIVGRAE